MTDYFVSTARGNDSTGSGTATSPWKTIGKAIGGTPAASLGASGARVFIEPGTYYESVTIGLTPSGATPLEIVGDCDGAGFLAGGYATPATGVVDWSAWTNDTTFRNSACLTGGSKSYVAVRRIKMLGGSYSNSCIEVGSGHDWTISDCILVPHSQNSSIAFGTASDPAGAGLNAVVERCDFHTGGNSSGRPLKFSVAETAAEYSLNTVVRNCRFRGGVLLVAKAATTGLGYVATGLTVSHCTFLGGHTASISVYGGDSVVLSTPISVYGCYISGANGIVAGHTSQVVEDYNAFHTTTGARQNVNTGAHSVSSIRPAMDYGDGLMLGVPLRPVGTPTPGSPLAAGVPPGSSPADDFTGRPRPAGFGSLNLAYGALERHDVSADDATYADGGAGYCLKIAGPGDVELPVLVLSRPTTISVKVRWDGDHGDATRPQARILAEPELGVAGQIATATSTGGSGSTPNAYETLTFSSFTPTKAGAVILRLASRPAAAAGAAYFDSISVAVV